MADYTFRDWASFECPECGSDLIHVTNTKAPKPLVVECLICDAAYRSLETVREGGDA